MAGARLNEPPGVSIRSSPASGASTYDRVDVERADDVGVQALEVEYPDVAVQAPPRLQHVTAVLAANTRESSDRTVGATMLRFPTRSDIQNQRGDGSPRPGRSHARQLTARRLA